MLDRRHAIIALLGIGATLLTGCPAPPDPGEQLLREGAAHFRDGNYPQAVAAYTRALERQPGSPGILVNRGNSRMQLEDWEGALADYQAALASDSEFALAYANRGILRDRRGDVRGAVADYRAALARDPELGRKPGIWKRILYNPPTDTIRDRLEALERELPQR